MTDPVRPVAPREDETAWLIEQPREPRYWSGECFTSDVNCAVRFARWSDADRVIEFLHNYYKGRGDYFKAVEHIWSLAATPVPCAASPDSWRCFHCDEVFTDKAEAKEHFGEYMDDSPLCLIKGQDGGLAARVRELEAEVMEVCKQRNESENDARLYHELSEEVRRRTNGHGLYMHLDYVEGEKLVLQEKVTALEAELARLRGEATVRVEE